MSLFWFGVGAGVAGISLIVWTMMRAAKCADDWLDAYGPLEPPLSPTQLQRMRPFNWADDGDWFDDGLVSYTVEAVLSEPVEEEA